MLTQSLNKRIPIERFKIKDLNVKLEVLGVNYLYVVACHDTKIYEPAWVAPVYIWTSSLYIDFVKLQNVLCDM